LLPANADSAQQLEDVVRHSGRQINCTEVVVNLYATDAGAVESGFVGNRTNDVARLHSMHVADFQSVCFHCSVASEPGAATIGTTIRPVIGTVAGAEWRFATAWAWAVVGASTEIGWTATITKLGFIKVHMSEFVAHEQRPPARREHSQRTQNLFFGQFRVFGTELLEDGRKQFMLGVGECTEYTFVEPLNPMLVDDTIIRERHGFDGLPRGPFKTLQDASATGMHEQNGLATAPGPTRASNAMHIGFAIPRQIVVDDV
jgi:hypothetical protein